MRQRGAASEATAHRVARRESPLVHLPSSAHETPGLSSLPQRRSERSSPHILPLRVRNPGEATSLHHALPRQIPLRYVPRQAIAPASQSMSFTHDQPHQSQWSQEVYPAVRRTSATPLPPDKACPPRRRDRAGRPAPLPRLAQSLVPTPYVYPATARLHVSVWQVR